MKTKIKSIISLILLCFVVTSCVTTTESLVTKDIPIKRSDQAMLVYQSLAEQEWVKLDSHYRTRNELRYSLEGTMFTGVYRTYHIHMIEPGTYSLDYLFINHGSRGMKFEQMGQQKLVTFEARPGEIIYIGDIDFSYYHKGIFSYEMRAKLEDKYEDAKAFLSKERPEIDVNLLKKQLVTIKPEVLEK